MASTALPLPRSDVDAIEVELDALRAEIGADLGARDAEHMRRMIRLAEVSAIAGRTLLMVGIDPLSWGVGVTALATAKILENMEIGHNVMHGQYDWTKDPDLDSRTYEWDIACTGDDWRHSHNYEHHTFTNIIGKDRDIGYALLRVSAEQRWHPVYLVQPVSALVLAFIFQWGVGLHDLRLDEALTGKQPLAKLRAHAKPFLAKAGWQLAKDYAFFPALALWNAPRVLAGNLLANMVRNLWSFAIIFCGHFPAGVRLYTEDEARGESRGQWYVRQLNGSANIEGRPLFHVLSGHLSHQIEHHLFPELPAARYPRIAPRVREICQRYGQAYNTGSFKKQLGSVIGRIFRHALPSTAA
jgi:linoleoyl-CoA desaturase